MQLDKRLQALAAMVPEGCFLADIGSDHAYLPAALLLHGKIRAALASDIAPGPVRRAQTTVEKYGLSAKLQVRQGSGLNVLRQEAVFPDCLVIAGMGATTIIAILQRNIDLAQQASLLLLQPMQAAFKLRAWLVANGWCLAQEKLVAHDKHLYEIIAARRGASPHYTQAELLIGPGNLKPPADLAALHITLQQQKIKTLLAKMERSSQARVSEKYQRLRLLLRELEVLRDGCNS